MQSEFLYKRIDNTIQIEKYIGDDSVVVVPSQMDGAQVTSIGDYAFSGCRRLYEITLPVNISSIGNHAFYNCRELQKITFSDLVTEIGDGAFKNCDLLRDVVVERKVEKSKCFKGVLSELNHEVWFYLQYPQESNGTKQAVLVFPEYLQDYVENTSAKIINQETYGSGVHYRECMLTGDIDYKKYDQNFLVAEALDPFDTVSAIALKRLEYPYKLQEDARKRYISYIGKYITEIVTKCFEEENMKRMEFLGTLGVFTEEVIDELIELAHLGNYVMFVSYFMNYRHKNFSVKEKLFIL